MSSGSSSLCRHESFVDQIISGHCWNSHHHLKSVFSEIKGSRIPCFTLDKKLYLPGVIIVIAEKITANYFIVVVPHVAY
jgi:hypothetical protein